MSNLFLSVITYKAWIHVFQKDYDEAEKCFLLAIQINKDNKFIILKNVEEIGIVEVYKRKVKILHQYLLFLTNIVKIADNLSAKKSVKYQENALNTVKEIIKIITKTNFEFDKEIMHTIHLYLRMRTVI